VASIPALVTPQQASQSARASSCLRVVPKVRVSCWRRPERVSPGTRMVTSTSALPMSRPATRSVNSGSSSASCTGDSYDQRATVADAVVRRSQGQPENLVRGLEAPSSGPERWLPASDCFTGSGPPRRKRRQRTTAATASQTTRATSACTVRHARTTARQRPAQPGSPGNGGPAAQTFTP